MYAGRSSRAHRIKRRAASSYEVASTRVPSTNRDTKPMVDTLLRAARRAMLDRMALTGHKPLHHHTRPLDAIEDHRWSLAHTRGRPWTDTSANRHILAMRSSQPVGDTIGSSICTLASL